ncbi:hydantoinase/oxoprolinase family protein [Lentibacter algarum]|uniref:hydantoinase/oxoprolinase N-terminal domain-containing protein n=1 Tax=Lentibacter algarum TaxID=576131 RepID=UPI001C072D85|nr:hydantoinase/oxoprolinase family protein [Lentibacter algarum]MBU2980318.1 hydantoinase/oxoprolinase family protein [Lentibacter algarum]
MAILLGVDTGGTYTDAVLMRDEDEVLASAKSLTTRHDLAEGIGKAVQAVLQTAAIDPADIGLVSLSTTLATNALVEGQGGRVALVYIGFPESDLGKHGLSDALKGDPYIVLNGGHDHSGNEASELDETSLLAWLETDIGASGFAVASKFGTRNPTHELRAMEMIREKTGKPVSASHQLSAKLNGPKRALTALLNARLIGMIDKLITRAEDGLRELDITAPLMVVRGDGALISADQAREKPIETILSGPAASIVGAQWMTNAQEALVSDIGGTTTDIALLQDGKPKIDPDGARVGPFRTMVEAVAMRTTGLGGDSEVHFVAEGLKGGVTLGPKRVLPVSLVALELPDLVISTMEAQLRAPAPGEFDGKFVRPVKGANREGLSQRDLDILERVDGLRPLGDVIRTRVDTQSVRRLVERGIVQTSGVTPSDACHALGTQKGWNTKAAELALKLLARRRRGDGDRLAKTAEEMAELILKQMTFQTSLALLETAFSEDDAFDNQQPSQLAQHTLLERGLEKHRGIIALNAALNVPVVGLGASASTYYPAVGKRLGCEMILPEHAGVANALGAVVGRVTMRRSLTITSPSEGIYRLHTDAGTTDFVDSKTALNEAEALLVAMALQDAKDAGAVDAKTSTEIDIRSSAVESREVFVEAFVTVEAAGRPRITA